MAGWVGAMGKSRDPNLSLAQLLAEKCELKQARALYTESYEKLRKENDHGQTMEALAGMLRMADEASDQHAMAEIEAQLDR